MPLIGAVENLMKKIKLYTKTVDFPYKKCVQLHNGEVVED